LWGLHFSAAQLLDSGKVDHGFDKTPPLSRQAPDAADPQKRPYIRRIAHKRIRVELQLAAEIE
jgi:hypothetical protein